jgi:hypothetical protein
MAIGRGFATGASLTGLDVTAMEGIATFTGAGDVGKISEGDEKDSVGAFVRSTNAGATTGIKVLVGTEAGEFVTRFIGFTVGLSSVEGEVTGATTGRDVFLLVAGDGDGCGFPEVEPVFGVGDGVAIGCKTTKLVGDDVASGKGSVSTTTVATSLPLGSYVVLLT